VTLARPIRQREGAPWSPPGGGGVVVIAGPDGTGKSTLSASLVDALRSGVRIIHHRPGILPARVEGTVTDTRARPPYGRLLSVLKALYIWIDFRVGWWLRVRPYLRRGWVVIERGWPDLLVDPLRYRLKGVDGLVQFLGRFAPMPDLCVVLEAPVATLLGRKQELAADELSRQTRAWRAMPLYADRLIFVDASRDPTYVRRDVVDAIARSVVRRSDARSGPGWTSLPSAHSVRWILPRGPRRVAAESLRIYQPVTIRGLVGWTLARAFAFAGGFRLLPRGSGPPPDVMSALAFYAAPQLSVALEKSRTPGAWIALLIDRHGRSRMIGPVATSEEARQRLENKRRATTAVGALPGPLSPPRILVHSHSVLLFEPVRWKPRLRAWRLEPDVAASMGEYFRMTSGNGHQRPSHNDFAPWNLMRSDDGWVVLDWEDPRFRAHVPFHDLFHYMVQAQALLGHPSKRALLDGLHGRGWVGEAIEQYRRRAGRSQDEIARCFMAYLRDSIPRIDLTVPEGAKELRVRERLVDELIGNGVQKPERR
jgi:thymidylate kinase